MHVIYKYTYINISHMIYMILTTTSEVGSSGLIVLSSCIDKDTEFQREKCFALHIQN